MFEKLFLRRLKPIIERNYLIPLHQFGFRDHHKTIDQVYRITNAIESALEKKASVFCCFSGYMTDVWQGVAPWSPLQTKMPPTELILWSIGIISNWSVFRVKQDDVYSNLQIIQSGVPQGSILGTILYLLYTYDLLTDGNHLLMILPYWQLKILLKKQS